MIVFFFFLEVHMYCYTTAGKRNKQKLILSQPPLTLLFFFFFELPFSCEYSMGHPFSTLKCTGVGLFTMRPFWAAAYLQIVAKKRIKKKK